MFTSNGMKTQSKLAIAAVVAAGAMAVPTMASATTVSPAGAFTATSSGNVDFKVGTNTVRCTASSLTGTIAAAGTGSVTAGTFTSCLTGLSGGAPSIPTTVTPTYPWSVAIVYTSATNIRITISNVRARINVGGGACLLDATGSVTGAWTNGAAQQAKFAAATGLTSTIAGGASCVPDAAGPATFTANYRVTVGGTPVTVGP